MGQKKREVYFTEEYDKVVELQESLTPEQKEELKQRYREHMKGWGKWVCPWVKPRIVGACASDQWQVLNDLDHEPVARLGHYKRKLQVFLSGSIHDGERWIHLSVSSADRLPTWEEMVYVKERFLDKESVALQVFPPRDEWVNVQVNVLHLWVNLDRRPTPDFRVDYFGVKQI